MNTSRKGTQVLRCTQCGCTFMMIGNTPVGMAFPRRVGRNPYTREEATGTCPAHRKGHDPE